VSTRLDVYLRTEKVGQLWLDEGGRFTFQYDAGWLASDQGTPLSLRLPLRSEPYPDPEARPFFANLLPESDLRRAVARRLGLSEQNDFALLEAVGGECAGAVSVLPEGSAPSGEGGYRVLDDAQLDALVAELPTRPLLAGEEGIRLSLAGAQNKLPVRFDERTVSLPLGAAPSSHILKPPIPQYPHTVENEYFCTVLAERVGLAVPAVTLLHRAQPLFLVERYDRRRTAGGALERIHQEDFCQALGIPPERKYEKEGGPSLVQCVELVRSRSVLPVADVRALLQWVIFDYLIGNADAHAKNISLLLTDQGPFLAPFYDILSTAVYPGLTERLAMRIGGEDRPAWIIERRWQQLAQDTGVAFRLLRQMLLQTKESVHEEALGLAAEFRDRHGTCPVIDQILAVIDARYRKLTRILTQPPA
jgi:serine/threonine-protein kinase HipA